jgi:hypothetical protein
MHFNTIIFTTFVIFAIIINLIICDQNPIVNQPIGEEYVKMVYEKIQCKTAKPLVLYPEQLCGKAYFPRGYVSIISFEHR